MGDASMGIMGTLIGLVVLAALFFWRLSTGPIKVDFLTPWIEQTLNDAETGVRVEIGNEVIDGTVSSRLDDARRKLAV